eukprot:CAMPEP_0185019232 /NCGR_PEP_ID=MMETSP1103-20130426/1860_1 /TAXON_ID=36769 /ORGANISM="Paraphysomonas bandaiensis, Strain Caron Lab Isolate" /LENGTH=865 /DNA_ID=CAMNT_0027549435 /DNA_START=359 /DNA_END=2956 /DNA_ORIENTATION=-
MRDDVNADEYNELNQLYNEAKNNKYGIHTDDAVKRKESVRHINWNVDASSLYRDLTNGKSVGDVRLKVIIEHVRDGSSFRCYVPSISGYVTLSLAGAICARVNAPKSDSAESENSSPEPFALQAKLFSELRLLHRELDVVIHAASKGSGEGVLLGTVLHPKGNITVEIVKAGLAKVADWTLAVLPREVVVSLRAAETEAKIARRGLWVDYTPPTPHPECRTFEGRVLEVLTGDTIIVAEPTGDGNYSETRITFSSIRVPRLRSGPSSKNPSVPEPFAVECKEFVRSKLIGKQVLVSVEYVRGEDSNKRLFASVLYGKLSKQRSASATTNLNIAEQLVIEGLATTVKHRGDEPRASTYDMMLVDEAIACRKKKGLHGNAASSDTSSRVNDVSTDGKKAKAIFGMLQKDKTYKALVEHVFTGSRFKVTIPTENVTLQLALSQVRCLPLSKPNSSEENDNDTTEQTIWAEMAKKHSRFNVLQRTVDIEISDIDRNGIFLGKLYMAEGPYDLLLVKEGLAYVDRFSASRGGSDVETLLEAQEVCKQGKTGLWSVENLVADTNEQEDNIDETDVPLTTFTTMRVKLSEIHTGSCFAVHIVGDVCMPDSERKGLYAGRGESKLLDIEDAMRGFNECAAPELSAPKKNSLVACLYDDPQDGMVWLRARIEEILNESKSARVVFVDYGHRATVLITSLRILPESLASLTPQAIECTLAFLRSPAPNSEHFAASAWALNSLAWDKECLLKVLSSSDEVKSSSKSKKKSKSAPTGVTKYAVALYVPDESNTIEAATNVNESLVRNGFLRVSATAARKLKNRGLEGDYPNELLDELMSAQHHAHVNHLRIWEYGHPGDTDDEMEERRAGNVPAARN